MLKFWAIFEILKFCCWRFTLISQSNRMCQMSQRLSFSIRPILSDFRKTQLMIYWQVKIYVSAFWLKVFSVLLSRSFCLGVLIVGSYYFILRKLVIVEKIEISVRFFPASGRKKLITRSLIWPQWPQIFWGSFFLGHPVISVNWL